jgi:hypothetical protein
MYADKGGADQGPEPQARGAEESRSGGGDDGAVDAEFEEVKDDKRK